MVNEDMLTAIVSVLYVDTNRAQVYRVGSLVTKLLPSIVYNGLMPRNRGETIE